MSHLMSPEVRVYQDLEAVAAALGKEILPGISGIKTLFNSTHGMDGLHPSVLTCRHIPDRT